MSSKNIVTGTLVAVSLFVALGACVKKQVAADSEQNAVALTAGNDLMDLFRMRKGLYPELFSHPKQDECRNLPANLTPVLKNYLVQDFHWKRSFAGLFSARYYGRVCIAKDGNSAWYFQPEESKPSYAVVRKTSKANGRITSNFNVHNLSTGSGDPDVIKGVDTQPQLAVIAELDDREFFGKAKDLLGALNPLAWVYGGGRSPGAMYQIKFTARPTGPSDVSLNTEALFFRRAIPQGFVPLFNEEWLIQTRKDGGKNVNTQSSSRELKTMAKVWSVPLWRSWSVEDLQPVYNAGSDVPVCDVAGNGTLSGDGKKAQPSENEEKIEQQSQQAMENDPNCKGKTPFMSRAILLMLPTVMELMRHGTDSTDQVAPGKEGQGNNSSDPASAAPVNNSPQAPAGGGQGPVDPDK